MSVFDPKVKKNLTESQFTKQIERNKQVHHVQMTRNIISKLSRHKSRTTTDVSYQKQDKNKNPYFNIGYDAVFEEKKRKKSCFLI